MNRSALGLFAFSVLIFAACLNQAGGLAAGAVSSGHYLGKTKAEIAEALKRQGYEVEGFENEGGLIEVEAAFNGVSYEIHVDQNSGIVVEIEKDD